MTAHIGPVEAASVHPVPLIAQFVTTTWREMAGKGDVPDDMELVIQREMTVCAAPFVHDGVMDDLAFLDHKVFAIPKLGRIWQALQHLVIDNAHLSPAAVAKEAKVAAKDVLIVAMAANYGPPRAAIPDYAAEMVRSWHAVQVRAAASASMRAAGGVDIRAIIEKAEAAREALNKLNGSANIGRPAGDAAQALLAAVQARREAGGANGATTGLADLDRIIGGLQPGALVVVAGRPGMGKSVLAGAIARHTAAAGNGCAFFSMELSEEMQMARFLADMATTGKSVVAYNDVLQGQMRRHEIEAVYEAAERFKGLPLHVIDRANLTVAEIRGLIRDAGRELRARGSDVKVVVLDYLKFIRASDRYAGHKVYEIGEITAALKGIAKEMGIAIVLVAQVNRANEGRDNKRPQLSDLRESGDIEQDADVVMFVYRDEYYARLETDEAKKLDRLRSCENIMEILVEKNRFGPTDKVTVWCSVASSAVRDLDRRHG